MKARPALPTLIAALLISFSGAGDAARVGGRSSSSAAKSAASSKPVAVKQTGKDDAHPESGKGISVNFSSSGGSSSPGGSSVAASAAAGVGAGIATGATAGRISDEDPGQAEKQSQQLKLAKLADDKRKADEARKRADIERLAKEAEEERKQDALRKAEEKRRKEQLRQQAAVQPRCVLKPIMSDTEIARCR